MNRYDRPSLLAALLLTSLLTACSETGDRDSGLRVAVTATGLSEDGQKQHPAAGAKHDQGDSSVQTFYRDGKRIDLVKGFVNLMPEALEPCLSANLVPIGTAYAHDGQRHGPDPSLIDLSEAAGTRWALGELSVRPGRYCGLRLALVPVLSATAAPNHVDMRGSGAFVQVCYYYDYDPALPENDPQNRAHYCVSFKPDSAAEEKLVPLSAPVELNAEHRALALQVGLRYPRWLDGIDLEGYPAHGTVEEQQAFRQSVATDPQRLQQLRENILRELVLKPEGGGTSH